jgi:FixJ family two-component response regulator
MTISERTVEKHRERLMHKMQAKSLAHLIRLVVEHRK